MRQKPTNLIGSVNSENTMVQSIGGVGFVLPLGRLNNEPNDSHFLKFETFVLTLNETYLSILSWEQPTNYYYSLVYIWPYLLWWVKSILMEMLSKNSYQAVLAVLGGGNKNGPAITRSSTIHVSIFYKMLISQISSNTPQILVSIIILSKKRINQRTCISMRLGEDDNKWY